MVRVRKKGCGRSKEGGRGKVAWKDWWERNWREDYATVLNISQSKKTSEKRGKNSSKESRSQECKVQRREGGWTNLHHTHLPPGAKKKRDRTIDFVLQHSWRRRSTGSRGGGGGDLKDAWEAREIGEFTQQCSVSPSSKGMRCSHVNREGAANARYGGDCLAPPYPSFLSCRILIKSLLISTWSVYTSIYHITEVNCLGDSFPVVPLISWLGKYRIISTENI